MDNLQWIGLAALVLVGIRFLTQVRAADWDGVVKQLIAWAAGIGAVLLYAQTSQADTLDVGGVALSALDGWDQVLLGLSVASTAGAGFLGLKALDNSQSAAQPSLVGERNDAPPE